MTNNNGYELSLMRNANKIWIKEDGRDDKAELFYTVALALNKNLEKQVNASLHALSMPHRSERTYGTYTQEQKSGIKKDHLELHHIVDSIQESMAMNGTYISNQEIYDKLDVCKLNFDVIEVTNYDAFCYGEEIGLYEDAHLNDLVVLNR